MEEGERGIESLVAMAREVSGSSEFRGGMFRKEFVNLSRRVMHLTPLLEDAGDCSLSSIREAIESAGELLRFGNRGSNIFMVIEKEAMVKRFQKVNSQFDQALGAISYDKLDISDEVREQVELVHSQFRRATEKIDASDDELCADLLSLHDQANNMDVSPDVMDRVTKKLELCTIAELKQESLALQEMVAVTGDPERKLEKMSALLRKIKDFVRSQNAAMIDAVEEKSVPSCEEDPPSPVIPDDFRCPISLELMRDPVIVATGQTYERSCIQKWLDAGHNTCPKSQQLLPRTTLTPNYALRSLISQWCESHGIEPPKRPPGTGSADRAAIDALIVKLSSPNPEDQLAAAGEIRLLAKRNADNRVCIASAGAVPILVGILTLSSDSRTLEHAVTALLNLSICENNKGLIMRTNGAIPAVVEVLRKGSMEARENAAATLFSLSVPDENKEAIGCAEGAIESLAVLLREGSHRGKKDAASALFNLCLFQVNKGKAVRAGVVNIVMRMAVEGDMVEEAVAIMALLVSHYEGKEAIGSAAGAVPILVDIITNGSPRNKENAAAVLLMLCTGDGNRLLAEAHEIGAIGPLLELAHNGTPRAKRKATAIIEYMTRFQEQQEHQQQLQDQQELQQGQLVLQD